jgi:hypothetical protein
VNHTNETVNIFNEHYKYLTSKHITLARVAYWIILQTKPNTYYPTNAATQEFIIQYNYKYREKLKKNVSQPHSSSICSLSPGSKSRDSVYIATRGAHGSL